VSFDHLKTIYRDYDIRGKYPEEIDESEVKKIAKALTKHFNVKKVAVGYDVRPSAESLFDAIASGFNESGVDVVNIGLCTTPMSYHMCGSSDVDMTVMITASHMPSDYNGLKITIEDSKPVSSDVLQTIRDIVGNHTFSEEVQHGSVVNHSMQADWIDKFKKKHDLSGSNISIVIDPANLIGILEIDTFKAFEPDIKVYTIFDDFDHSSPNHEANPIKHETLVELGKEVVDKKAHLGVAFDGDADRLGFVDEAGIPISNDVIGALLARYVLAENKGGTVVCDIRSSKATVEEIERLGGKTVREKVGHTHIRGRMREEDAVLGIELSGHFFFKETYFSEGGPLAAFIIMELINKEKKTLSQLAAEVKNYFHSGEINSTISQEIPQIYENLELHFSDMEVNKHDGLTLTSEDWWCNIRPSANDPVMRLNLEADTQELMEEKRDEVLAIIRAV
jgi:phosphomannomutase